MAEQQRPDSPFLEKEEDCDESAPLNPGAGSSVVASSSSAAVSKIPIWYDFSSVRSLARPDAFAHLKRLGYALIPSWITTHSATTPSKAGISALDGLRGIACLFVFNEHYVICYQSPFTQVWIMRVPFIRLLWYGKAAVFLFFVISGYVLSYKPLKLIRSKSYLDFQKTISSSFLRRAIRLYLPCLIVSFIACIMTSMGFFDRSMVIYHQYKEFVFLKEEPPPRMSFADQLRGYMTNVEFIFSATIPFDKDTNVLNYFMYDDHQWTIPKEFRSSMAVFALLVTTSRMRSVLRLLTIVALGFYAVYTDRLYSSLFFAGMVCAELDLIRQAYYARHKETLPSLSLDLSNPRPKGLASLLHLPDLIYKIMWVTIFIIGVFFISSPQEVQQTRNFLPDLFDMFWSFRDGQSLDNTLLLIGSIMVVWSVATCPTLGPLFNNPFVAYLGKISYALYLVHGTVIKSLGYNILPWTLRMATGTPSTVELDPEWWSTVPAFQKVMAYFLGLCFVETTCFWLSDLFWRFVDIPCVTFARKVEGWMTKGADAGVDEFTNPHHGRGPSLRTNGPIDFESSRRRAASIGPSGHLVGASQLGGGGGGDPKRKNG